LHGDRWRLIEARTVKQPMAINTQRFPSIILTGKRPLYSLAVIAQAVLTSPTWAKGADH
jgi:hypothetical protein